MKFQRQTIRKTQTLGERIKRVRRKKRISLANMEGLTKIRSRYITAIEKGEYEKLPGDIYIKGFLRTIAKTLNMDANKLINLYQEETKGKDQKSRFVDRMKGIRETKIALTPKFIFIFLGFICLLLIGGYFWYQVSGFAAAPRLDLVKPGEEDITTNSDEIIISGATDPGTMITINDQPITVDLEGNFNEVIKLKSGANQIVVSATNRIGKEVTKNINVLSRAKTPLGKIAGEKEAKLVMIIEISPNPAWISIEADGKKVYQGIILAKNSQEFIAKNEIILASGNAGSTRVYLNGNDLGLLGEEGELVRDQKYDLEILSKLKKGDNE